jgi:hypothetical protein
MTEDLATTKQALARGYAILVLTAGGKSLCWTNKTDDSFIKIAIPQFLEKHRELKGKPLYLTGASSGGGLMQRNLAKLGVKIDGVIAVVATSPEVKDIVKGAGGKYPPIVWTTMAASKEINKARELVAGYKKYAPAAMATVEGRRITDTYFSDRHPLISPAQSAQIAAKLKQYGTIKDDGKIAGDPKEDRAWVKKLVKDLPFLNNKNFQTAPFEKITLLQAMLAAVAHHEHNCDYITAGLMWLESNGKADFESLAKKYRVVRPALLTADRQRDGAEPTPAAAFAYGA